MTHRNALPIVALVDDDPEIRALVRVWLSSEYEIEEHETGGSMLGRGPVGLAAVCLDLSLGDMSGLTVLARLQEADADLPVVVVSAQRQIDAAVSAMQRGAYDYVVKPLDQERVVRAVRRATTHRALAIQRKHAERKLNETLLDLQRSREDLLHVLNQLRIGTILVEADRSVAFANETSLSLCSVDGTKVLGRCWEEVLPVTETSRQAIRTVKQLPERDRTRIEVRLGSSGDGSRWVELDVRDDPRDPARQIFFLYDVSDTHELRDKLTRQRTDQMIGESQAMQALYELIDQVAAGDWTVLVQGETGTGKELVARSIHAASRRRDGPFIAVNCAGLSDGLLGSQLFGHKKGAFTGATADQQGLFEAASGGTLFLDEIGDISASLQAALLRVIQEKEVTRLGETRPRKVDTRIVVATHRNLKGRVESGHFREDLLYRIRSARVQLPPLRERREDIPLLITAFLAQQRVTAGKLVAEVAADAMQHLCAYDWPGNVRELRAAIEYAVVRCRSRRIEVADLAPEILQTRPVSTEVPTDRDERTRIVEALRLAGDNRVRAARILGMGRATLYRRLTELGLDHPKRSAPGSDRDTPTVHGVRTSDK